MHGETDLSRMLATLSVERRPDPVTFVSLPSPVVHEAAFLATIVEAEGTTVVLSVEEARHRGWPVEFEAAWLTLEVHSALDAVGLTAAFSEALAERDIPCNVLAGYHHDHLLVPVDRADDAVDALASLRDAPHGRG